RSIWVYCSKGMLSFEFEIDSALEIPPMEIKHARDSKNKKSANFIRISDPKIIGIIGNSIKNLNVQGAEGKGIFLGMIDIAFGSEHKQLPVMSTLIDWREWLIATKRIKVINLR
ncbi:MAG: hypothetical protein ACTSUI_03290, partial [Promethearchaeota archaeon]